ncbi:MAG: DUF1365 domain-containing protein [Steroidobacteraceae bacterium]
MKSCFYTGHIQHRRHAPRSNAFRYRIYMMLLDLDELPTLFDGYWFWSARRPALAWFRRRDFHGDASQSLTDAVRDTVEQHIGKRPTGPIRLLTHLRYFGYSFNPVSFYYVFDAADTRVEAIVAEITNTPWKQRHCYVLDASGSLESVTSAQNAWRWQFDKRFHVSPFMPMDMRYHWRLSAPDAALRIHMENWRDDSKQFDATLTLQRQPISSRSLAAALLSFPLITLQVITLIHWQALKLFITRVPVFTHPDKQPKPLGSIGRKA